MYFIPLGSLLNNRIHQTIRNYIVLYVITFLLVGFSPHIYRVAVTIASTFLQFVAISVGLSIQISVITINNDKLFPCWFLQAKNVVALLVSAESEEADDADKGDGDNATEGVAPFLAI